VVTTLRISGMTCNGCVGHVRKALAAVPGVSAVEVSLPDHAKIVHADGLALADLTGAVDGAGYSAVTLPPPGAYTQQ
jgi:copper chaperone CopZ